MKPLHHKTSYWIRKGLFDDLRSFSDFENRVNRIAEEKDRGDVFEIFIEGYLATQSITQRKRHWLVGHIPLQLRERYNLPRDATGIDGIYETHDGSQIAYQVKYRQRRQLTFAEVAPFLGLTEKFSERVIFTNATRLSHKAVARTRWVSGDVFRSLPEAALHAIEAWIKAKRVSRARITPDSRYQTQALADIRAALKSHDRATVVMACGTGKTLVALWAVEEQKPRTVLVLLPSLTLLQQTLREWSEQTAWGDRFSYICICSDKSVAGEDAMATDTTEMEFPVRTDPKIVRQFLQQKSRGVKVIFSTYQSSPIVGKGTKGLAPIDVAILDEAHKTTGLSGSAFGFALSDKNIRIQKRLFLTATPRHIDIRHRNKEGEFRVLSMDDESIYGPRAHTLSFSRAVNLGIICRYKVLISLIDKVMVDDFTRKNGVTLVKKDEVAAGWMANLIAVQRAIDTVKAQKIITFHGRVKLAREFAANEPRGISHYLKNFDVRHVNGAQSSADRSDTIKAFASSRNGLLTNARCLTEGVNIPAVDMVAFVDPRQSRIDITQAVGRAMRKPRGKSKKTVGYVVVPLFAGMGKNDSLDEAVKSEKFEAVADVLNALQEHDEELVSIIRDLTKRDGEGKPFNPKVLSEKIEVIGPRVNLARLTKSIGVEVGDRLGESWDYWFGLLLKWRVLTGKFTPAVEEMFEGKKLGIWVASQRSNFSRGTLALRRIDMLSELPGWSWNVVKDRWSKGLNELRLYSEKFGHACPPDKYVSDAGFKLGSWAKSRRLDRQKGRISDERIRQLEAVHGWSWSPDRDNWNRIYNEIHALCKTTPLRNIERSRDDKKISPYAAWISAQKRNYASSESGYRRLSSEEIEKLERLPDWSWNRRDDSWHLHYSALSEYLRLHGIKSVTPSVVHKKLSIGRWLVKQRAAFKKGTLEKERTQKLSDLGCSVDVFGEKWRVFYELAKEYANQMGTSDLPQKALFKGSALGSWVSKQRQSYKSGTLSQDRINLLESLPGWRWDASSNAAHRRRTAETRESRS